MLAEEKLDIHPGISSNVWKQGDPRVWDCDIPGKAIEVRPIKIALKDLATITCKKKKKKNPFKTEARAGLQSLLDKFLKCGILKSCQSSYNTPILPIKKPKGGYRMV